MTWPEKWKARYVAEGHAEGRTKGHAEGRTEGRTEGHAEGHAEGRAEGRAEGDAMHLASLGKAVRARFGEAAAQAFGQQLEAGRQAAAAQDPEIMDAIYQCVMLSEDAEQLLAGLQSIRLETA